MEGKPFSEPPKSPTPQAAVLREKIAVEKKGKKVLAPTKRISKEGKQVAAAVVSQVREEGMSTEDIRQSVQEIRLELKTNLAARKKELRAQIQQELTPQEGTEKGKSAELRAAVREQLAIEIASDATVAGIAETRKLLSSINQRVRIQATREALAQISDTPQPAQETISTPPTINTEPPVTTITTEQQTAEADTRANTLQVKIDRGLTRVRVRLKDRLELLNWKKPLRAIATPAAAVLIGLAINGSMHFQHQSIPAPDSPMPQIVRMAEAPILPVITMARREETAKPIITQKEEQKEEITVAQNQEQPAGEVVSQQSTDDTSKETPKEPEETQVTIGTPEEKIDPLVTTKEKIEEIVNAYKEKNVEVALSVIDISTGERVLSVNPDRVDVAASTAKIYTAAAILDAVSKGEVRLTEKLGTYTVKELLRQMVNQSDNTAWKLLDKRLGTGRVQQFAHTHGATHFDINKNTTTPDDLAMFLANLQKGDVIPDEQKEFMLNLMRAGTTSKENLLTPSMGNNEFFHKWGLYGTVIADTGITKLGDKYYSIAVVAGGKSFMNPNFVVTDPSGIVNREKAIRDIGPLLADGLTQVTILTQAGNNQNIEVS